MSFKNYLQTRKPSLDLTWDFTVDSRDDVTMPNVRSWNELENYLKSINACEGALKGADLVWRCFQMQKKKGKKFLKKECAEIRKEFEERQQKLFDWRPRDTAFYVKSKTVCPSALAEIIMGLVIQDQQVNNFSGPNGFPAVEADTHKNGWQVTIYTRFGAAPPILFTGLSGPKLLRENYKKAITSENFPELYKTVVDRICYLENGDHKNAKFNLGSAA